MNALWSAFASLLKQALMHCFHSQVPPIQFSSGELLPYSQQVSQHFMLCGLNHSRNVSRTHNPCQPLLCHDYLHCKAHPILIQRTTPILSASLPSLHALGRGNPAHTSGAGAKSFQPPSEDPFKTWTATAPTMSATHTIHINPCYAMTICIARQHLASLPCAAADSVTAQALCYCPTPAAA
jgi:hypothetical protein